MFAAGSFVGVSAQGTSASKSGGPPSSGTMTDEEWAYFLWLLEII